MKTLSCFLKNLFPFVLFLIAHTGNAQQWQWAEELYFPPAYSGYLDAWNTIPLAITDDGFGNTFFTGYQTMVVDGPTYIEKKFLVIAKFGQGNLLWKKILGGLPENNNSAGTGIVTNPAGNIYITGYFENALQLGRFQLQGIGGRDIFLAKFTSDGLLVWWRKAGGGGADEANGITLDAQGNIFLTGSISGTVNFGDITSSSSTSDFFLAKYDGNGTPLWVERADTENGWSKGRKIHTDNNGNISVLGEFDEDVMLENTSLNANSEWNEHFIAKFTDGGNLLWTEQLWGSQPLQTVDIATDVSGNTFVTGSFYTNVVIGSSTLNTYNGYEAAFIAKFSAIGNVLYARQTGSQNSFVHYSSRSISTDADGNSYITGYRLPQNASNDDLWVRKYNAGGWVVWTKINQFSQNAGDAMSGVIQADGDGNVYVTGNLSGNPVYLDNLVLSNYNYPKRAFVGKIPGDNSILPFLKFYEAIVCFPCFPFDPVLDYEYRFWSERAGIRGATYRKVSDPDNRDEIIWKGERLEIKLHDELDRGGYYFQLRAIAEDGAVSDWTEALAFYIGDRRTATLVYPNPVKDWLTIEYKASVMETILITLFDRYGKLLLQQKAALKEGENVLRLVIPSVKQDANPLTLQLQSKLQGTSAWQLIRE